MELFGVGIGEAGLVLLIALLVVGPERFPEIAREAGKYYRLARRFTAEVTGDLRVALNELENEVNEQTGDLRAVREIGAEVRARVNESATDIDSISRGAAQAVQAPTSDGAASTAATTSGGDPFAKVTAAYTEFHTPAAAVPGAPAAIIEAAPDVNGEEMSRQAAEAFEEFRKPEAAPVAAPYSPQQIVGVNPFASTEPPMVAAPVEAVEDDAPVIASKVVDAGATAPAPGA